MRIVAMAMAVMLTAVPALAQAPVIASAVRQISVQGEAEAKLAPDQAEVMIDVHSENKDLAKAKADNDKKLNALLALAEKQGIAKEDIRTTSAMIQPQYDYNQGPNYGQLKTYAVSNNVSLTVKDVTKIGGLMNGLVAANIDRVNNIQFSLKDRRQAEEGLLTKALANARAKADKMAAAYGDKVGKALVVTEQGGSFQPPPIPVMRGMMAMKADAAEAMPTGVPAGLIEIKQSVSVTFMLE